MPIVVRCPNGACNQPLQVPDQYAGMQGKCPQCGTLVHFPAAGAAAAPPPPAAGYVMTPPPAPPPAYQPPPPAAYPPPAAAGGEDYAPPEQGHYPLAPARAPMSTQQLVDMIALPAGLFFLFLLLLSTFLPWQSVTLPDGRTFSISGLGIRDAVLFLVLCLLLAVAGGLTYLMKALLPHVAALAAGFGTFSFFVMLGAMLEYRGMTGAGVWVGLIAALGAAGAFITLSLYRPVESPAADALKLSPLLKRHAALFLALALGTGLGFVYLVLAIMSRRGPG